MRTTLLGLEPSDIKVSPDRQRKEFPEQEHRDLMESIRTKGLMHAPGIVSGTNPTLVFGERRLRAMTALIAEGHEILYNKKSWGLSIPVVQVGDLSDIELCEIELEENLLRRDLTWQEEAAAIASLRALREQTKDPEDDSPITIEELATETDKSSKVISEALALSNHLDDPDVAAAKSKKEARKIIERKAKESFAAERAKDFDPSLSQHKLFQGDCREIARTLPSNTFSCIVTDPPYGIDMHKDLSWDGTWHEYDDTEAYCFNLIESLLPEWSRVTQDEAHLYIFCDFSKFEQIRKIVADHGTFEPMYFPIIWNKGNIASYPRPEHWPRKSYECILYAIKGNKPQNKLDLAVVDIPQIRDQAHPAGKPSDLYAHLIARSCLPGDEVLDCFAGQGTIFRAAKSTSTIATGIEMSEKYIVHARNTLKELGE